MNRRSATDLGTKAKDPSNSARFRGGQGYLREPDPKASLSPVHAFGLAGGKLELGDPLGKDMFYSRSIPFGFGLYFRI
jgi:hypothetical protein